MSSTSRLAARALVVALLLLVVTFPSSPAAAPAAAAPRCPSVAHVPLVGLACLNDDGLYSVFGTDGSVLGTTHGADVLPAGSEFMPASSIAPKCVNSPTTSDYYVWAFYVYPTDVTPAYATKKPTILATMSSANGWLHDGAIATGTAASVRVKCDASSAVVVTSAALTTTKAATTFSSVSTDLKALGYTEINAKHWVFVDGGATDICSCGVGNIYNDDTLAITNANNGKVGTVAEFAVNFAMSSHYIAIHELTHNMGGVQRSAPHSTFLPPTDSSNAWHCNDGLDVMCYNDGGSNLGGRCSAANYYCSGVCATSIYDCGKDDYFHRAPPAGNYLATHWNVGNPLNRFVEFSLGPVITTFSCTTPKGVTQVVTCTLNATDDNSGVRYSVAWGDSTTTCVPSCSTYVAPATAQTVTHTYSAGGTFALSLTATDNGVPAQTSAASSASVLIDATAPVSTLTLSGTSANSSSKWYSTTVNVALSAVDTGGTGVGSRYYSLDGGAATLYTAIVPVTSVGSHSVTYWSVDVGGNVETARTTTFGIDKTLPTLAITLSCTLCVDNVVVSWSAADAQSSLETLSVLWRYPEQGTLASGTTCAPLVAGLASAASSCTVSKWLDLAPGSYCMKATAQDRAGNRFTTTEKCATIA